MRWTIKVRAAGLNDCDNPVTVPAHGIRKTLVPGDSLVEPTASAGLPSPSAEADLGLPAGPCCSAVRP